ncbi:hypothetical protein EF912_01035 [Streptomyces sp. WAC07061]|nr:hypothetical protein EF912_01035 [Streptomyces sp. WAC07061]
MVFGKKEPVEEAPVVLVAWERVRDFVIGNTERPVTVNRRKATFGPPAVRVPKNGKDYRILAPCAYVGHVEENHALYADVARLSLLCLIDKAGRDVDGERHHDAHDGQGLLIGTLRRVERLRVPARPLVPADDLGVARLVDAPGVLERPAAGTADRTFADHGAATKQVRRLPFRLPCPALLQTRHVAGDQPVPVRIRGLADHAGMAGPTRRLPRPGTGARVGPGRTARRRPRGRGPVPSAPGADPDGLVTCLSCGRQFRLEIVSIGDQHPVTPERAVGRQSKCIG